MGPAPLPPEAAAGLSIGVLLLLGLLVFLVLLLRRRRARGGGGSGGGAADGAAKAGGGASAAENPLSKARVGAAALAGAHPVFASNGSAAPSEASVAAAVALRAGREAAALEF